MKKIRVIATVLIITIATYFVSAIVSARSSTPERIAIARSKIAVSLKATQLSDQQLKQLLKFQDENFFEHGGTDFSSGRITTITQGLVKFIYFENFKPGLAKIKQSLIARFALNSLVSKDEQLNLFLSLAYLGNYNGVEVRGFGQASQIYFGKQFSEISQDEYFSLLVMLSSPDGLNIKLEPTLNAERVAQLKQKLATSL